MSPDVKGMFGLFGKLLEMEPEFSSFLVFLCVRNIRAPTINRTALTISHLMLNHQENGRLIIPIARIMKPAISRKFIIKPDSK
jgi:hypothetical protein